MPLICSRRSASKIRRCRYIVTNYCALTRKTDERLWGDQGFEEGLRRYQRALQLADQLVDQFPQVPSTPLSRPISITIWRTNIGKLNEAIQAEKFLRSAGRTPATASHRLRR